MKLGVCYYPEHWPEARWPEDARLMRDAGLSVVRIGEFAWQQMEPEEGRFDWGWLDRAVEALAGAGLQVVLGTPTAAPPAWLCHAYPDVLPVDVQGRRRRFGSRRHYCSNSPDYHRLTERVVAALAGRYGPHPAVAGWQIDNEFGCHDTARCYCGQCAAAFRAWLRGRYGSLAELNAAWGTAFWSQAYGDWDHIQPPNLTVAEANPSQVLDYYRFSSDSVLAYQQLQIDTLRARIAPGQFITTNFMGNFPDLDYHALAGPLDFVTWDSYPTGYAERQAESLYLPGEPRPRVAFDLGDPYVTGFCHDLTYGLKGQPFWVMEQQCGHINWGGYNPGIGPGAVRLWTWHALASGADAVVYFRWRACLLAQEQQHSGLLRHDAAPDVGYQDVLSLRAEAAQMAEIAAAPRQARVALLVNYGDLWALQLQPHHRDFGYFRHLFVFYRALQRQGLPADLVPIDADLAPYRLVIAPTAFLNHAGLAGRLSEFAARGGTLVLGVRSGFKTRSNRVNEAALPGAFRDLVGAAVERWQSVPPGLGFDLESEVPGLGGRAALWAESLAPDSGAGKERTGVLARYASGPFAGSPAATERPIGQGRAVYLGFYPDVAQAGALLAALAAEAGISPLGEMPEGLVAARRGQFTLLLNFTDTALEARLGGEAVRVEAREVRVVNGE